MSVVAAGPAGAVGPAVEVKLAEMVGSTGMGRFVSGAAVGIRTSGDGLPGAVVLGAVGPGGSMPGADVRGAVVLGAVVLGAVVLGAVVLGAVVIGVAGAVVSDFVGFGVALGRAEGLAAGAVVPGFVVPGAVGLGAVVPGFVVPGAVGLGAVVPGFVVPGFIGFVLGWLEGILFGSVAAAELDALAPLSVLALAASDLAFSSAAAKPGMVKYAEELLTSPGAWSKVPTDGFKALIILPLPT